MTAERIQPKDPRAAAAKAALHRLAAHPAPDADPATAADRALLTAIPKEVDACVKRWFRLRHCPACQRFGVLVLWGPEHVLSCGEHPVALRLARAEAAWRAASEVARALGQPAAPPELPPRRAWPPAATYSNRARAGGATVVTAYVLDHEVQSSLRAVCTAAGRAAEKDLPARVKSLEVLIEEWGHYQDRAVRPQPCPCCGEPFDVVALADHLVTCAEHPDRRRAEALERAVAALTGGADTGVEALVDELHRHRGALNVLVEAGWSVLNAMGYLEHGRSYLRHADEEAFEQAVRAAAAGLEAPAAAPPGR